MAKLYFKDLDNFLDPQLRLLQDDDVLGDLPGQAEEAAPVGQVKGEEDDREDHPAVLVNGAPSHPKNRGGWCGRWLVVGGDGHQGGEGVAGGVGGWVGSCTWT